MPYINTDTNQYPTYEADVRRYFPYTSFTDVFVAPYPFEVVFPAPVPEYDPVTQTVVEGTPVKTSKGHYEQTWSVVGLTLEQINANTQNAVESLVRNITSAVQDTLDTKAKERNYDGILSACTYATSSNIKFKAEGQACVDWRDSVWATCYEIMGEVQAGMRQLPSVEQVLSELPQLVWPS